MFHDRGPVIRVASPGHDGVVHDGEGDGVDEVIWHFLLGDDQHFVVVRR